MAKSNPGYVIDHSRYLDAILTVKTIISKEFFQNNVGSMTKKTDGVL